MMTIRSGNYRIDSEGNPIIKAPRQTYFHDDGDYFDHVDEPDYEITPAEDDYPIELPVKYQQRLNYDERSFNYDAFSNYRLDKHESKSSPSIAKRARTRYHAFQLNASKHYAENRLQVGGVQALALVGILALVMVWMGILISPFRRVNQVVVSGNQLVDHEFVILASGIEPLDSKKAVQKQRLAIREQVIQASPFIQDLSIDTSEMAYTELIITENDFIGWTQAGEVTYYVLSNGESINLESLDSDANRELLPELIGFTQTKQYETLGESLLHVDVDVLRAMQQIYASTNPEKINVIEIQMADGNIVRANLFSLAEKIKYYPEMLEQIGAQTGIINLEIGAYFTPMNQIGESIKLDSNLPLN